MNDGPDHRDDVRRIVMEHLPEYSITSVEYLGEGMDNTTFEVNGELVVRLSKDPNTTTRGAQVSREAHLLAAVASISTVRVPQPVFVVPHEGCSAYKKLLGIAVVDLPCSQRGVHVPALAATVGMFLSSIHAIPTVQVQEFVDLDSASLSEYLSEATEFYNGLKEVFSVAQQWAVEAFLDAPLPDGAHTAVLCHNDLSIDHILVDPSTWDVTGIIDWSDAAITDPAYDFALMYRDLGPEALEAALGHYRSTVNDVNEMRERATFVGRCKVFEDLHYGTDTQDCSYIDSSMLSMEWLFPSVN